MLKRMFLFSMLCLASAASAQENNQAFFSVQADSLISAENESLVALTVILENKSQFSFTGKIELKTIDGIALIAQEKNSINLDANSKVYYPIRLFIGKNVSAGETAVVLALVDEHNSVQAQFSTKLLVQAKKQVRLLSNQATELMQNIGDSLSVSALLSNQGNSNEMITITASFPNLRGGNQLESKQVFLNAFQDTVISFGKIITKELLNVERYTVNIAALYDNGDLINNIMVGVQNVSGNRTYTDPSQGYSFESYSNNRISISGRNLLTDNEAMQLNARGVFQLETGSLDFSVDGYQYTRINSRPLLTNTYLNYQHNNKGITLGNISENLETFVNGRGIKVNAANEEESKRIEIAVVDKSYNLLGDEYRASGGNGYTAYAKTFFSNQSNQHYSSSILYDRTPYNHSESLILMNEYEYRIKEKGSLGFELGGGLARMINGPVSSLKPSIAIGNKFHAVFGKYTFGSNNFYSSGYYPGIRRGVLQLNERISRSFNKFNTWISYSFYNYDPKYFQASFLYLSSNTSNSRIEGGTYFPLTNNISLSLSAKRHTDQGRVIFQQEATNPIFKMNAFRLTESINWRSRNDQHTVYISSENGFSTSPFTGKQQLQLRANANWNYRFLTLNSYLQQGDFSIMEAYSNVQFLEKTNYRFNVSTSMRKEFFNNKLKAQFDVNYNRDSYSGSNWMYSGLMNYMFSHLFSGFVNTYFYNYTNSNYRSAYSNIQAGLSYNLPHDKIVSSIKNGNLSLFLFFDNNANGVFDDGDTPAEGRIVMIGGLSFISQADGSVLYKKVPYGNYALNIPSQNWYADVPAQIHLQSQDIKWSVPLKKTSKITGKLSYQYDHQTSEEIFEKHGGLRLIVKGDDNFERQALTNAKGEFMLFVPVGEYEFWVDESSLPKNVYTDVPTQKIEVKMDKTTIIPEISLKVKERIIEMKRFSSP